MEGKLQFSPKLGYLDETDDIKYVSKLSTILVATIQEAKDRISQIEYIFCTQLYSNFQSKSKSLHKLYLEAKKEAEDIWKEKEKDLLLQIEKLQLQNQEALEENRCLKLEKDKALVDLDEKVKPLLTKEINQQERIDKLELEVRKKSREVDEGLELHNRLLQLIQSNSFAVVDKTKQLKENEEKTNKMLAEVKKLEQKIEELQEELRKKTEMIADKEELTLELYKKIESLMSALTNTKESASQQEKEKKELLGKLEILEYDVCELHKKLRKKTEEYEEVKVVQEQLLQRIDVNNKEILKQKQKLEEAENGRKMLLQKSNGLEEKLNELQGNLSRSNKVAGKDSYEKLLEQIQLEDSQLLSLKEEKKHLIDAYKRLKSQYIYLCKRCDLTEENMLLQIKSEDESVSLAHQQNPETAPAECEIKKVKAEPEVSYGLEDDQVAKSNPISGVRSPISNHSEGLEDGHAAKSISISSFRSPVSNHIVPRCPPTAKSVPVIGTKRPASRWVDTRSRRCKDGPDPHDDFLDTPLENLRVMANKAMNEKFHNPIPDQNDVHPDNSDDETQDIGVPCPENQQMQIPVAVQKEFKYVEPVRKKAERENLKGVECKQCKKFYDAVLPKDGKDGDDSKQNFRCEHHEGVSRHRYKYAPPMTPEGFWNIGFESEM